MNRYYSVFPVIFALLSIITIDKPIVDTPPSNCSLKLISKTNPITGKITFASKDQFTFKNESGDETIELLIVRQNAELTLRYKSTNTICLSKATEINVVTRDKNTVLLKSNSPGNCTGTMIFNFGGIFGKESARDFLYEKGIESVSFEDKNENGYFFTINPAQKDDLKLVFQCLLNI